MQLLRSLAFVAALFLALGPSRADAQDPISFRTTSDTVVTDSVQTFIVDICTGLMRDTSAYLIKGPNWTPLFLSDGPAPQCGGGGHAFMMDATLKVGTSYVLVEIVDVNYTVWRDSIFVVYQLPGGSGQDPAGQPKVVAPVTGGVTLVPGESRTLHFQITNVSAGVAQFEASVECSGALDPCQYVAESTFLTGHIGSGHSKTITFSVKAKTTPGTGTVRLIASGDLADTATVQVSVARDSLPSLVATRYRQTWTTSASTSGTVLFTVMNPDLYAQRAAFLSTSCVNMGSCSVTPGVILLPPGKDTVVRVSVVSGTVNGKVRLHAASLDGPPEGVDSVNVTLSGAASPSITVTALEPRPRSSVARSECLSIAGGPGTGVECGGLRLAYTFPSLRTMNKDRALRLLYLSQHAVPHLTIPVRVTIPYRTDSVGLKTTLSINSVAVVKTFAWHPSCAMDSGCVVNVPVYADSLNLATGDYAYSVQVELSDAPSVNAAVSGIAIVVNRKESLFGSGWWLEGLETLMPARGNAVHRLWIGGDGSARLFIPTGGGNYAPKDTVDRPERLQLTVAGSDSTWIRHLRNGAKVTFDKHYRHVATTNREGHVTIFGYSTSTSTRAVSISMPVQAATAVKYEFMYDSALGSPRLRTVRTPWTASTFRDVTLTTDSSRRILTVKEPSSDSLRFTYTGSSRLVTSRVDRAGNSTVYAYAWLGLVSRVTRPHHYWATARFSDTLYLAVDSIASRICSVEARTLASCELDATKLAAIPAARYLTHFDGPFYGEPVDDRLKLFIGRFGAVDTVVAPFGATTRIARADALFPALVTKVVDPSGVETHTTYGNRGLPLSTRVLKQWDGASADTTSYTWHATWDLLTERRAPTGEITRFGIDSATGNQVWMQRGTHDSTRVYIAYDAWQRPDSIFTVAQSQAVVRGTYVYESTFGNLETAVTALGHRTRYFPNRAGVVDSVWSTLSDTTCEAGGACLRQRFIYDGARRITEDSTFAPARDWLVNPEAGTPLTGSAPALTAVVSTAYDAEGRPLTVTRRTPGWLYTNAIAISTYAYDDLGRLRAASTGGSSLDSTYYDRANNPIKLKARTGHVIEQTFDALGRLTSRTTPETRYAKIVCTGCNGAQINPDSVRVPYFATRFTPDFTSPDVVIPLETVVFAYDLAGRMVQADNALVRIRRSYYPNGALKTDTSETRLYVVAPGSSGFVGHRTALAYTYDRVGRRTSRTEGWGARQTYGYDALGQLSVTRDSVLGVAPVQVNFTYDYLGRLLSQTVPGTSFNETWTYDDEDRPIARSGSMAETIAYDIRGKRTRVDGALQYGGGPEIVLSAAYDGLGHLVATGTTGGAIHTSDEFIVDGFGNALNHYRNRGQAMSVPESADQFNFVQGRLWSSTGIIYPDDPHREGPLGGPPVQAYDQLALTYDGAGNVTRQESRRYEWSPVAWFELAVGNFKFTWTFHDGNGKPRFLQVRSRGDSAAARTDYNEYWYDALGRRVLAREYSDSISGAGTITRFAWDGDQLLRESRAPGGPYTTGLDGWTYGAWGGTRRYTQTGAIDTPLVLWLDGAPRVVVRNWRGSAAGGIIVSSGSPDTLVYPAASYDVQLAPDALLGALPPNAWLGSLISEQTDASGLLYRRNRYYDPATGRFTQEDPIGLRGGMNLYGYAGGGPVNFSDPFGLCKKQREDGKTCNQNTGDKNLDDPDKRQQMEDSYNGAPLDDQGYYVEQGGSCDSNGTCREGRNASRDGISISINGRTSYDWHTHGNVGRPIPGGVLGATYPQGPSEDKDIPTTAIGNMVAPGLRSYVISDTKIFRVTIDANGKPRVDSWDRFNP